MLTPFNSFDCCDKSEGSNATVRLNATNKSKVELTKPKTSSSEIFGKNIFDKIFSGKIFSAKIFLAKIFSAKIFLVKIFSAKIFFSYPFFPHLTALQTTPTSSQLHISDFWSWVWHNKRNEITDRTEHTMIVPFIVLDSFGWNYECGVCLMPD